MAFWLLERRPQERVGYDEHDSCVIRAPDEATARIIAAESVRGDEGADAWLNPGRSTCTEEDPAGPSGLILASFNAG